MATDNKVYYWRFQEEVKTLYESFSASEKRDLLDEEKAKVSFLKPYFQEMILKGVPREEKDFVHATFKRFNEISCYAEVFGNRGSLDIQKTEEIWDRFLLNNSNIDSFTLSRQEHGPVITKAFSERINVMIPKAKLPAVEATIYEKNHMSQQIVPLQKTITVWERSSFGLIMGLMPLLLGGFFSKKTFLLGGGIGGILAPYLLPVLGKYVDLQAKRPFLEGVKHIQSSEGSSIVSSDPDLIEKKDESFHQTFASCFAWFDLVFGKGKIPSRNWLADNLSIAMNRGAQRIFNLRQNKKEITPCSIIKGYALTAQKPIKIHVNHQKAPHRSSNEYFHGLDVLKIYSDTSSGLRGYIITDLSKTFGVMPNPCGKEFLLLDFAGYPFDGKTPAVLDENSVAALHVHSTYFSLAKDLFQVGLEDKKTRVYPIVPS